MIAHVRRPSYIATVFPVEQKAYYIQMNQVDDNVMGASLQAALAEVDRLRPEHLTVDLRYNFGGDGSRVNTAMHEFIRRKDAGAWTQLYVLTGRKTFSAGVMLLAAFKEHLNPTVIGEPPGAPLNSYGDPAVDPILRGIDMRSIPAIALASGGSAAREVWEKT